VPGTAPSPGTLPCAGELGFSPPEADPRFLPAPGETAARARLARWTADGLSRYAEHRDLLAADATSRLGQDLHFGLLSPVEMLERCRVPGEGPRAFVRQLCWRDFYGHVLWHWPHAASGPLHDRFEAVPWRDDPDALAAWREGRTGYPVVDAAMRQLRTTGWMPNRARMIAASFLAKDLLIDWRLGEAHFMHHLVDGDLASNNGGWQWAASTGTDAQPFFRIFNPVRQGERFDTGGEYVRRWVPELARVPDRFIHAPWTMPNAVQGEAGCRVGADYPAPIVDHSLARERAIGAFRSLPAPWTPSSG
jgi:deoxyribodipyrimidine photo-lyase